MCVKPNLAPSKVVLKLSFYTLIRIWQAQIMSKKGSTCTRVQNIINICIWLKLKRPHIANYTCTVDSASARARAQAAWQVIQWPSSSTKVSHVYITQYSHVLLSPVPIWHHRKYITFNIVWRDAFLPTVSMKRGQLAWSLLSNSWLSCLTALVSELAFLFLFLFN